MKLLRTISIVIAVIGIFVWLLGPLVSNASFRSSDGYSAASFLTTDSEGVFKDLVQSSPLYWMPLTAIILLCACLLFIILKQSIVVALGSAAGAVVVTIGGKLIPETFVGLSVGYYALQGFFVLLFVLSILSLFKIKDEVRAVSILASALGGVMWFTVPFISFQQYQNAIIMHPYSLVSVDLLEYFPKLEQLWQATPFYWMPLAIGILLVACLLFAVLKKFRWVCVSSLAAIIVLAVGGALSSPLNLFALHLGIGYFLFIGLFVFLTALSIMHIREHRTSKSHEQTI